MSRFRELDGFQLFSGVASIVAGPIMLVMGAPAGWAFLIMAAGTVVLVAQWAIIAEITFDSPDVAMVALTVVGVVAVAVAVVYLTRAADDLPTVFPGYDPGSENFRLLPGVVSLIVGAAALARAIHSVHPRRPQNQHHSP
ncbi:MAG: hypothetical protein ACLPVY_09800 [Acidimicrobiia bacterium]